MASRRTTPGNGAHPALGARARTALVTSDLHKADATIEAIDAGTRTVVLKDPHGLYSVEAGPAVRNFDKLQVGDKVHLSYYQGLAARIKKGDTAVSEPVAATYTQPAQGGKPGGEMGHSVTTTVTIQAVDPASHTVAFKNSDGSVDVVAVERPNMREFVRTLNPGDVVELTYTESIAVDITPER